MALKSQTREIGGRKFSVTELPTDKGLPLFFALGKLVGPSLATLLQQWRGKQIEASTVAAALTELLAALSWDTFKTFVDTFAESSHVLGRDAEGSETRTPVSKLQPLLFAGDYLSLCMWLGFCLEVNFASFFAGMGVTKLPDSAAKQ